jgi:hypothetical protein
VTGRSKSPHDLASAVEPIVFVIDDDAFTARDFKRIQRRRSFSAGTLKAASCRQQRTLRRGDRELLVAWRLTTRPNFVGAWTDRSPEF